MRRIITAVLFLSVLAVLLTLGVWQVQRLAWKEALLADIDARIMGAPVEVPLAPDPEADRYLPVVTTGEIGGEELHVLVSSRDYGAGFRIISPLTLQDGRRVLLDRGFVLSAQKDAARAGGVVEVTGNLHWPDERSGATPEDDPAGNWWFARDVDKMADALNTAPILIIARSETGGNVMPMPITTQGIHNRHLEYAVTWFSFAAIWVLMTGFALWRIRRAKR